MDYKQKYLKYKTKYINLSNQYGFGLPSPTPNDESPMPTPISSSSSSALPMPTPVSSSPYSASALPMPTPVSSSSSSASALPTSRPVSSSSSSASALPTSRTFTPTTQTEENEKYTRLLERIRGIMMDRKRPELERFISNAVEFATHRMMSSLARTTKFDASVQQQMIREYRNVTDELTGYKAYKRENWIRLREFIRKYNSYPEFREAFKPLYDMALDAMVAIRVAETLQVRLY